MKKIGFIDYYLSEWHANNYPKWIKEVCDELGYDYKVAYAYAEVDVSPITGKTTDEWCQTYGATKCSSIKEVCEKSDYLLILAPSNPEKHLEYAKEVFECGKPVYIDKTFAPDYVTAKEIFELANKSGVKFFSSSALRFADEIEGLNSTCKVVITQGGGDNIEEYLIHQAEMVVKVLGIGATNVKVKRVSDVYQICVDYADGKKAIMNFAPSYPFTITFDEGSGKTQYKNVNSPFFKNLIKSILNFFENGIVPFDCQQTLEVARILENVIKCKNVDRNCLEM